MSSGQWVSQNVARGLQGLQMCNTGIRWSDQKQHDVDRLAVQTVELDSRPADANRANDSIYFRVLPVWDGNALADSRCAKLFAFEHFIEHERRRFCRKRSGLSESFYEFT